MSIVVCNRGGTRPHQEMR